jgi:MFS family permease
LLWMPRLSEIYGRAKFFKFAMALNTIMFSILMFSRSYALNLFSIFVVGFFTSMRTGVGWPYLLELVPKSSRPLHATFFGMVGASWGLIGALFFFFFSNNAYLFMGFGYVLQIVAFVFSLALPESPVYLLSKGKIIEGEVALA